MADRGFQTQSKMVKSIKRKHLLCVASVMHNRERNEIETNIDCGKCCLFAVPIGGNDCHVKTKNQLVHPDRMHALAVGVV